MSGASPSLIVRTSKSLPHIVSFHGDSIRGISGFDGVGCEKGLIYVDNEVNSLSDPDTFSSSVLRLTRIISVLYESVNCIKIHNWIFLGPFEEYL